MPYWAWPEAITLGICGVLAFSRMDSRTRPVIIITSTAGTRPLPSARTTRRCDTTPWTTAESWARIWSSWWGGKIEMMRLIVSVAFRVCRVESHFHGLRVAHFTHEDDVGILAEGGAQGLSEARGVLADLALADHALLVLVDELHGVFDGHDVVVAAAVHEIEHSGQGGRLAGARDTRDEDQAAALLGEPLEHLGQVQPFESGNVLGNVAEHGAHVALAEEEIDTEAADPRHGMREVHLLAFHEGVVADLPQHVHGRLAHEVTRHRGQVVLRLEVTVHPHDGAGASLEVEVGGVPLHALGE